MIQLSHLFDNVWARLLYHYMTLNGIYDPTHPAEFVTEMSQIRFKCFSFKTTNMQHLRNVYLRCHISVSKLRLWDVLQYTGFNETVANRQVYNISETYIRNVPDQFQNYVDGMSYAGFTNTVSPQP